MKFANAIAAILALPEESVYTNCRNSLLHKIIQDATYSSTSEWRYRHPEFYWSNEAVIELADLAAADLSEPLGDQIILSLPDVASARELLRQEHVVPTGVVIRHLLQLEQPANVHEIFKVLDRASTVCIVTSDQNRRLHKTRMPPEHSNFLTEPWARYLFPREGQPISVSPYSCEWHGSTLQFIKRSGGDSFDKNTDIMEPTY